MVHIFLYLGLHSKPILSLASSSSLSILSISSNRLLASFVPQYTKFFRSKFGNKKFNVSKKRCCELSPVKCANNFSRFYAVVHFEMRWLKENACMHGKLSTSSSQSLLTVWVFRDSSLGSPGNNTSPSPDKLPSF